MRSFGWGVWGLVWLVCACEKPVHVLEVTPDAVVLTSRGETRALRVSARDADGRLRSLPRLIWASADESIASVDVEGVIVARRSGATRLTVEGAGLSRTIEVDVRVPKQVVLSPANLTLVGLGDTAMLAASVQDELGRRIEGAVVRWQSDAPSIVNVVEGRVTALAAGTTSVRALFGALEENVRVEVALPVFERMRVEPAELVLSVGEVAFVDVVLTNAQGARVAGVPLRFELEGESVVVEETGRVSAVGVGQATVAVRAGEQSVRVPIVVRD